MATAAMPFSVICRPPSFSGWRMKRLRRWPPVVDVGVDVETESIGVSVGSLAPPKQVVKDVRFYRGLCLASVCQHRLRLAVRRTCDVDDLAGGFQEVLFLLL